MKRRDAGRLLVVGPLAVCTTPLAVFAQPSGNVRRIGYLSTPTRASVERPVNAFVRRLRELGWVEGQNLVIEYRFADGDVDRLPILAADLLQRNVELIVAPAASAALAAQKATKTIPIVMIFPDDPVGLGLVASLGKPGANITGTTFAPGPELAGKQLEILKEALPSAARIGVLWNPADQSYSPRRKEILEDAARSLHVRLLHVDARGPQDFDRAFEAIAKERADGLLLIGSSTFFASGPKLAELALKNRLPTMNSSREMVELGGLMSYAINMADFVGRAAVYVDKVLRGAKPAELAVEQPTKFELVVNLKTAKALSLTIPRPLLLRADEIIE